MCDYGKRPAEGIHRTAVCTTPWAVDESALQRARDVAEWFGVPSVPRSDRSIERLLQEEQAEFAIVADTEPRLYHASSPERPLFFHPGIAQQRIRNLRAGMPDRLIQAIGIRPGDHVIDATLGLGADTLVLAEAVGSAGIVTAVESSPLLCRLFTYAKAHPDNERANPDGLVGNLWSRIRVHEGHHGDFLSALPEDSVDVVYFDPMFRMPTQQSSSMDVGRAFANPSPVSEQVWKQAVRVARRAVALKERPLSGEFERFGLIADKPRAKFAYGVLHKE